MRTGILDVFPLLVKLRGPSAMVGDESGTMDHGVITAVLLLLISLTKGDEP
jgi:hypothetical protein